MKSGVIPPLCEVLEWRDQKLVGVVLEALEAILKVGEQMKHEENLMMNPYVQLIEEVSKTMIEAVSSQLSVLCGRVVCVELSCEVTMMDWVVSSVVS